MGDRDPFQNGNLNFLDDWIIPVATVWIRDMNETWRLYITVWIWTLGPCHHNRKVLLLSLVQLPSQVEQVWKIFRVRRFIEGTYVPNIFSSFLTFSPWPLPRTRGWFKIWVQRRICAELRWSRHISTQWHAADPEPSFPVVFDRIPPQDWRRVMEHCRWGEGASKQQTHSIKCTEPVSHGVVSHDQRFPLECLIIHFGRDVDYPHALRSKHHGMNDLISTSLEWCFVQLREKLSQSRLDSGWWWFIQKYQVAYECIWWDYIHPPPHNIKHNHPVVISANPMVSVGCLELGGRDCAIWTKTGYLNISGPRSGFLENIPWNLCFT